MEQINTHNRNHMLEHNQTEHNQTEHNPTEHNQTEHTHELPTHIVPQHRHNTDRTNTSHTKNCSIDIIEYNPYNDRYSYEDEVEYNEGVQKIIHKLVKIDTED